MSAATACLFRVLVTSVFTVCCWRSILGFSKRTCRLRLLAAGRKTGSHTTRWMPFLVLWLLSHCRIWFIVAVLAALRLKSRRRDEPQIKITVWALDSKYEFMNCNYATADRQCFPIHWTMKWDKQPEDIDFTTASVAYIKMWSVPVKWLSSYLRLKELCSALWSLDRSSLSFPSFL